MPRNIARYSIVQKLYSIVLVPPLSPPCALLYTYSYIFDRDLSLSVCTAWKSSIYYTPLVTTKDGAYPDESPATSACSGSPQSSCKNFPKSCFELKKIFFLVQLDKRETSELKGLTFKSCHGSHTALYDTVYLAL